MLYDPIYPCTFLRTWLIHFCVGRKRFLFTLLLALYISCILCVTYTTSSKLQYERLLEEDISSKISLHQAQIKKYSSCTFAYLKF
jgi:glycopeptide antibiotics resistance protein